MLVKMALSLNVMATTVGTICVRVAPGPSTWLCVAFALCLAAGAYSVGRGFRGFARIERNHPIRDHPATLSLIASVLLAGVSIAAYQLAQPATVAIGTSMTAQF